MSESGAAGIKLVGISGSLREGAYSAAVLHTIKDLAAKQAEVEIFPLNDIPLYNQDLDTDEMRPEAVSRMIKAIGEAHGLILVTPEYNYGTTGVLKNALDWASRPAYNSVLKGKPTLIAGSSIAFTGGVRAVEQVKQLMLAVLGRPLPIPDIIIAGAQDRISDGKVTDKVTLKFLEDGINALIEEIQRLQR